jgi:sugar O-acyltransferase (sialic acid O-acetyltransferase NeuD family)
MQKSIFGVYGASGFGREIMPIARAQLERMGIAIERLFFIDDGLASKKINGHSVVTFEQFIAMDANERFACIGISNGKIRAKLADRLMKQEVKCWSLQAPNIVVMDQVELGDGGVLCPFVTLTSNIKIGRFFHANIYSYVAHDCIIGDFVTFAPCVKCNGNVKIEDYAYIGTGAVLKQGNPGNPLIVGKGAIIGMGAVVTKNVPSGEIIVGNPARTLRKNENG